MIVEMTSRGGGQGMAQASQEISNNFGIATRRRYRQARVMAPLHAIDQMLDDLEHLNLAGRRRVPLDWDRRLALLAISLPAEVHEVPELRSNVATARLMDRLYEIQDTLLDIKVGPVRRALKHFDCVEFGDADCELDVA